MLPGDLPESVTRRAVHADRTHVVWNLADAPDVIDACEEQGTLLRLASVVQVCAGKVVASDNDAVGGRRERRSLTPPPWPERVARAAASARERVEQARPWAETLDAETDAAFFVTQPVSRVEAGRVGFPTVLLLVLAAAPLLCVSVALVLNHFVDWRSLPVPARRWLLGSVAALAVIGLAGGLLVFAATRLTRSRTALAAAGPLGAPRRPGDTSTLARTLARVGELAAVTYIWGPMMGLFVGAALISPGDATSVSGCSLSVLLAFAFAATVAHWRQARST